MLFNPVAEHCALVFGAAQRGVKPLPSRTSKRA
jgi:hypothetical protein